MSLDFAMVLKFTDLGNELKLHARLGFIAGLGYRELI